MDESIKQMDTWMDGLNGRNGCIDLRGFHSACNFHYITI